MWWSVSESQALLLWSVHQGLLSDPKLCKACMYPILSVLCCFWDFRLFCGWFTEEGKWPNLLGIFQVLHSDKRKEGEKTTHWQGSKLLRHLSPSFLHGSVFPPFVIWFYFFFLSDLLCSPFLFLHKLFNIFHFIVGFSVSFSSQSTFLWCWHLAAVISVDYFMSV